MPAPNLTPAKRSAPASRTARAQAAGSRGRTAIAPGHAGLPVDPDQPPLWKLLAVSLLLFLLVEEWLQPLPQLSPMTELYDIRPFLALFGMALLLDGLRIPSGLSALLKGVLTIGLVGYLFYPQQFASLSWLPTLAVQVRDDVLVTMQGHYEQIGGETRTLLFAAGWCMMISVVHALLVQRQQAIWLGCITVLYLLLMQLIFGMDTTYGILRAFLWSGLLLAMLLPDRLARTRGMLLESGLALRWSAAAAVVIVLCAAFGWYGWKPGTGADRHQLMKPLDYSFLQHWPFGSAGPYADNAALNAAYSTVARTGYSSDDSMLGGPIQPDNAIAFEARTSKLTYWRGEARSVYTGKGWKPSTARLEPYRPEEPQSDAAEINSSASMVRQEVMLPSPLTTRLLFTGGMLRKADVLLSAQDRLIPADSLRYDAASGAYSLPELSDPAAYYQIESESIQADPALLRQDNGSYPADIADDLQLPASVPARVRELARTITAQMPYGYDKAAAIADYLRAHYRYSMSEPTTPSLTEDFVDHFLYSDRTGYCDQFSTAMVVMLRAVDVPARWVKGYAPGTEQDDTGAAAAKAAEPQDTAAGMHTVIVRNLDAHSWVEVYFPSYGWVPFDPTPGFAGYGLTLTAGSELTVADIAPSSSNLPINTVTGATLGSDIAAHTKLPYLIADTIPADADNANKEPTASLHNLLITAWHSLTAAAAAIFSMLSQRPPLTTAAAFAALTIAALLYTARTKWPIHTLSLSASVRAAGNPRQSSILLMDRLWSRLYRSYGTKAPNETIREYVAGISETDDNRRTALNEFAMLYELLRYDSQQRRPIARRTLHELWKRIH